MKKRTYLVFLAAEGCGEEYLGEASGLRLARHMAAQHSRGEIDALEECLYDTARTAGHCAGMRAPPAQNEIGEPVAWFGRGGWYCACPKHGAPLK